MSVESIKSAIRALPEDQKSELAAWLNSETFDDWDREILSDFSDGGRGEDVLKRVKERLLRGEHTPMPGSGGADQE